MAIEPTRSVPTTERVVQKVPVEPTSPADLSTAGIRDLEVEPVNFTPKDPIQP